MTMIKRLKPTAGFTLIEIIIAMTIFSIIVASAALVLNPTLNIYRRAKETAEVNTLLDTIANEIISDFKMASSISITGIAGNQRATITRVNNQRITRLSYEVRGGILFRIDHSIPGHPGVRVLDDSFYGGKNVRIIYDGVTEFTITVVLLENGNQIASREYAVNPVRLS
jgi:prepilin-type N-terminal cleavage/methylation domain-containing protein